MATAQLVAVLQVGDTSTPTDSVDLNDGTNCIVYTFDEGTIAEPPGPNPEDTNYAYLGRRTLKLGLYVVDTVGQSYLTAEATIRKIEHKLTQAQRALGAGGQWIGTPVTLRLRNLDSGAPYVYADVAGGTLTQLWAEKGANPIIHCTLALSCLPYFHGDLVTTPTLAISSAYQYTQLALAAIPGDRSASTTLYFGDASGSGHINRIRVGRRSFPSMNLNDFSGVVDCKPDGGSDIADATAANSHYCRITATASAQKIATAGLPDKFNSWETGDFTGMTGHSATGAGALSEVVAGAAYQGNFGYHAYAAVASGNGNAYFQIPHVTQATYGESWINVRNTLTTGQARYLELDSTSVNNYIVALMYTGSAWQISVRRRDATYVTVALSPAITRAVWTKVRLVYEQLPGSNPLASCYTSTDGRIWTLAAQYADTSVSGSIFVPDILTCACANDSGAIIPEAWYDQFQVGDWAPLRAQTHGKINVWARARTSIGAVGVNSVVANPSAVAGTLQSGGYTIVVTALDGSSNESAGSIPASVSLSFTGEALLSWTDIGTPANHRVYVNDTLTGASRWSWVATGSATSSFTLSTALPLANSGAPPTSAVAAIGTAYLRGDAAVATPGGTPNYVLGQPQPLMLANSNWETVFLGTYDLPPAARGEQNAASANVFPDLPWYLTVQGIYAGIGSPTIDVDAIWLIPADEPSVSATYTSLTLAANEQWEIDTRRDGHVSGVLREQPDLLVAGQVRVDGRFTLGVGKNIVVMLIEQGSGINSWANASANFYLTYRPRYVHLPDAVT